MQKVYAEIRELGAELVAICPQRPEFLRQMRDKHNLEFDILRDFGNEVGAKFGLRFAFPDYLREVYLNFPLDLARVNSEDSWTLSMPSRYVVDQAGIVAMADFDPDYTYRPEATKTIEDLKALKKEKL